MMLVRVASQRAQEAPWVRLVSPGDLGEVSLSDGVLALDFEVC